MAVHLPWPTFSVTNIYLLRNALPSKKANLRQNGFKCFTIITFLFYYGSSQHITNIFSPTLNVHL